MLFLIGIVLLAPFAFFTAYLLMLSILARVATHGGAGGASRFRRIAVVIPAHNEAGGRAARPA